MAPLDPGADDAQPYRDSTSSSRDSLFSESESGDVTSQLPKTSTEQARYDQQVLDDEDEREELLTGNSRTPKGDRNTSKPRNRRKNKKKKTSKNVEEGKELMYDRDVEEGATASRRSSLSDASSAADREKIGAVQAEARKTRKKSLCLKICKWGILNVFLALIFVLIAYGAFLATRDGVTHKTTFLSNGTQLFAPTTILVSLDGFRADFLHRNLTPTLNGFIKKGVSPIYMLPSFPSVTFPNHFTLATGLHPESHGVVGNTFWDPNLKEEFYYTHESAMQPKWWDGEPIWVTAEQQGVRTAIHMWPGSEAHIGPVEPSFLDKFNGSEVLSRKVDRILELLDKPGPDEEHLDHVVQDQRPQVIMAYVPNVDQDGHKYGPNSTEIRDTITDVDTMLANLFDGLEERNLTDLVNVVVVSDHGMATTSVDRLIQFEDLVDPKYFSHTDGWPLYGLRLKDEGMLEMVYDHLIKESGQRDGFDVYLRDVDMPKHYHFSNNDRIAPLWIVPHTGWAIVTLEEFNVEEARKNGDVYHPRGLHGYDYQDPLMRSIFVARGPAFPHKPGSKIEIFQNIEVYNILCDSVGVKPVKNNGTLRLPFKTSGLHSDKDISRIESLADPPTSTGNAWSTAMPTSGVLNISRPVIDESANVTVIDLSDPQTWPDWFHKQVDWVKDKFAEIFGTKKAPGNESASIDPNASPKAETPQSWGSSQVVALASTDSNEQVESPTPLSGSTAQTISNDQTESPSPLSSNTAR